MIPHTIERGSGFPLVLLHGNSECAQDFSAQLNYFSKDYRVIAVDTRGHGASPRGTAPFTLEQFAEDLKRLLDRLSLRRVHLLGFSDGGNIALLFALRYPRYVDKLILNGANLYPSGVRFDVQLPVYLQYALTAPLRRFSPKIRTKYELLSLMASQPHICPEQLSALTMPVLVIAGSHDMIRTSHTRQIARSLPNAQLCILPGDHFIAYRAPDAFNAAVSEFLLTS